MGIDNPLDDKFIASYRKMQERILRMDGTVFDTSILRTEFLGTSLVERLNCSVMSIMCEIPEITDYVQQITPMLKAAAVAFDALTNDNKEAIVSDIEIMSQSDLFQSQCVNSIDIDPNIDETIGMLPSEHYDILEQMQREIFTAFEQSKGFGAATFGAITAYLALHGNQGQFLAWCLILLFVLFAHNKKH